MSLSNEEVYWNYGGLQHRTHRTATARLRRSVTVEFRRTSDLRTLTPAVADYNITTGRHAGHRSQLRRPGCRRIRAHPFLLLRRH